MKRRKLTTQGKLTLIIISLLGIIAGMAMYIVNLSHICQLASSITVEVIPVIAENTTTEEVIEQPTRYELTDSERNLIERVVQAEAGNQSLEGQMAVAQCILNAMETDGYTLSRVLYVFGYATPAAEASESVKNAVKMVFDYGEVVTNENILYFYNPAIVKSSFHESQTFVIEIGNHRFFKRNGD